MASSQPAPATKADITSLKGDIIALEQRLNAKIAYLHEGIDQVLIVVTNID